MALSSYERLLHEQVLTLTNLGWKGNVLTANFGDGWGAGAIAGSSAGLHRWALSSGAIPDMDEHSINYELSGSQTDTRFDYYFEFFKRHITTNNKPFYIKNINTEKPKMWLVSFESDEIDFSVWTGMLYGDGAVILRQRRVSDLSFNADGSIDIDETSVPANLAQDITTETTIRAIWDASTDGDFAVAGYEVDIDGGSVQDVGDVLLANFSGLTPDTAYDIRVRSYDEEGFRSGWSSAVEMATDAPA